MTLLTGRTLSNGFADAPPLILAAPLSLWRGLDLATGAVVDATHADRGRVLAGGVLVMPAAPGSSSSSSALVEAARRGTAPAAILLAAADPILALGALVSAMLYDRQIPIVVLDPGDLARLDGARRVHVDAGAPVARLSVLT